MSFNIYSENLVDQSTITGTNENLLFPLSNIKDPRRSKVFRSTTNSDSIVFDFNETSPVDTLFVMADKRAGFGFSTIELQFNGTDNWTSPAHTESITFSTEFGVAFKEFTEQSYRFCRIVLTSTLGYCELSKVFLGKKQNITKSINYNWAVKDNELSTKQTNRYGQIFTDIISRRKELNASMTHLDKDDLDSLNQWLDRCGESKPFFIKIGCDGLNTNDHRRLSGMYYLTDAPQISNSHFNKYRLSISLIEAT
jgi:hypothetical protein